MAYEITSASNLVDLLTFIRVACVDNGWTLSGDVLHKGNCYIKITQDGSRMAFQGGTGKDGSNLLTGAAPHAGYFRGIAAQALTFPLTAEIHINTSPDEVYVVINYALSYYQLACWGMSDVTGLTGTGMWFHGCCTYSAGESNFWCGPDGGQLWNLFGIGPGGTPAFWCSYYGEFDTANTSFIHGDVDGRGWHGQQAASPASSFTFNSPLLAIMPNAWASATVFLPFPIYVPRIEGSKNSLVADLKHMRHVRVTSLEPGQIITLGPDRWKCYPWFKKNTAAPNGGSRALHSGTLGYALRYTGP